MLPFSRLVLSFRRLSAAVVAVMSSRRLAMSFCSAISCRAIYRNWNKVWNQLE
jgi:hypothetical protein